MSRINDKIKEIEKYLCELCEIIPPNFKKYENDFIKKAACERYFERITEAVIDLSHIIIKDLGFPPATEDINALDILNKKEIINEILCEKLKNAKRMRNILAHQYGCIDDEIVFKAITTELKKDIKEFLHIIKRLNKNDKEFR